MSREKLKSPSSKALSESEVSLDYNAIKEAELSMVETKGRIMELQFPPQYCGGTVALPKDNTNKIIDGGRLYAWDHHSREITIKFDHSEIPSFWMEAKISLDDLEQWIGIQEQYTQKEDESDEEDDDKKNIH